MAARGFIDPTLAGLPQWQALALAPLASVASTRGQLVFASQAFLDLVRWTPEELTRQSWLSVIFPDPQEREAVKGEVEPLYQSGGVLRHQIDAVCGDGVRRVFDLTTTAITMPDGSPGLMSIAVDSSGQAMPVGGGERGVVDLVEDALDIMMRVEALTGRVLYVNRAVERLTGYTPEEFYRDPGLFARIILPEQRPAWEALVLAAAGDLGAHLRSDRHRQERPARHPGAVALSGARRRRARRRARGRGARQYLAQAARGDPPAQPGSRLARSLEDAASRQRLARAAHAAGEHQGLQRSLAARHARPGQRTAAARARDRRRQHAAPGRAHRDAARPGASRGGALRAVDVALRSARRGRPRPPPPSASGWRRATCRCASISAASRCRSTAIARASSRCFARSSATPRSSPSSRAAPSTSTPTAAATSSRSRSPTAASASPSTPAPASSSASTRSTRRRRAASAAPGSGWPSPRSW